MAIQGQANCRDLKLFAISASIAGAMIYCIIPFGLALTVEMHKIPVGDIFTLIPFWEALRQVALVYQAAYILFVLILLSWIFFAYLNILTDWKPRRPQPPDIRRLKLRRWPWRSGRRHFSVLPPPSAALTPGESYASPPRPAPDAAGTARKKSWALLFAVAGFFLPVWFFYHPYFIMKRLWGGSAATMRPKARLIGALWLLANPIFGVISMIEYGSGFHTFFIWPPNFISSLVFIPFTCWLMFRINKMQKTKFLNV